MMLVKDEADIIEHTVRHLLGQVDEVLIADNMSTDGTTEILLDLFEHDTRIQVATDEEPGHYQGRKTTELAMRALALGHRWVVPCDADEIWYAPDGRTVREWLIGIGRETQFVKAAIYNHVATAHDNPADPDPVTRIGWRQAAHLEIRWGKVACRLRPDLEIDEGNHSARTQGIGTTAYGLEIRHFPYRSAAQFVSKATKGIAALRATDLDEGIGAHWRAYGQAVEEGGTAAGEAWFYDAFFSDDPRSDDTLVFDPAP